LGNSQVHMKLLRDSFWIRRALRARSGILLSPALAIALSMTALGFGLGGRPPLAAQGSTGQEQSQDKKDADQVPVPLPRGKKLVLKDGSFQIVRSYQRQGDRVRYYSVERSAWEEIPADLVDWAATAKAEADDAKKEKDLEEKARTARAAEIAADIDVGSSIEVVPGVFLPETEGIYALQDKRLLPLAQSQATLKTSKGQVAKQILVPIPVVHSKRIVLVSGKHAALRLTTPQPEFYFRTADKREPEMEMIRTTVKGDARQLAVISKDIAGDEDEKRNYIVTQKWKVANGVYRFTIDQALEPGEYALAEILPDGMDLYVWDFGIDPPGTPPVPNPKATQKTKNTTPPNPNP